jgi:hypothetical protein
LSILIESLKLDLFAHHSSLPLFFIFEIKLIFFYCNSMLETMSRAEAMLDDKMHWIKVEKKTGTKKERVLLRPPAKMERERLLNQTETTTPIPSSSYQNNRGGVNEYDHIGDKKAVQKAISFQTLQDALSKVDATTALQEYDQRQLVVLKPKKYIVTDRKFEMNVLCRVFLGKRGLRVFTLFLSLYMCGTLWAYTSVFSSAMARQFPIFAVSDNADLGNVLFGLVSTAGTSSESLNYVCYAILFGCMVVPLSCLELDEQVPLQVFLTGCRFVMFFLMLWTSGMCADDIATISELTKGTMQEVLIDNEIENFRWSGAAKTLPILIFANIFHHSIPGLTHPAAEKRKMGGVFLATNLFTTIAYLILGLTLASAFGKGIEQSSNLNWSFFHANTGQLDSQGNIVGAAWWTRAVSMYIILFPAIDVVSAFPLNAITFGNSLFGAAYGKRIHEVEDNRWLRTAFRLLASIPPIIFGILVRELGVITDYTGTTGFMIGLIFPALLYLGSRRVAQRRKFALDTFYTGYGSTVTIANVVLWTGIVMVLFVMVSLTTGID